MKMHMKILFIFVEKLKLLFSVSHEKLLSAYSLHTYCQSIEKKKKHTNSECASQRSYCYKVSKAVLNNLKSFRIGMILKCVGKLQKSLPCNNNILNLQSISKILNTIPKSTYEVKNNHNLVSK